MRCRLKHGGDEVVERRRVGGKGGGEGKALALRDDADAVVAQGAGDEHLVAGLAVASRQVDAGRDEAHACGVDEHAVGMAALDDLRVAGHDGHARLGGRLRHRAHNLAQLVHGIALFEHEAAGEVLHLGARGGHVVDRAAHGKAADVPAGEELGRHHERVGAHGDALASQGHDARVVAGKGGLVGELVKEQVVDEALHHRAARAMAQTYLGVFLHVAWMPFS